MKYDYPFILAEMREENNGTTIKLDVLSKYYYNSYPPEYDQIDPKDKLPNSQLWELDMWAARLRSLYQDLHGTYDYGLDWGIDNTEKDIWKRMRKDWSVGPYNINRINKEQYEELKDVNIGDKIIAINGTSTDKLYYPNQLSKQNTPAFLSNLQSGCKTALKKALKSPRNLFPVQLLKLIILS